VCNCTKKYFGNVKAEESKKLKAQFIHCLSSKQKGSIFPNISDSESGRHKKMSLSKRKTFSYKIITGSELSEVPSSQLECCVLW
jgi:hypothetical protein